MRGKGGWHFHHHPAPWGRLGRSRHRPHLRFSSVRAERNRQVGVAIWDANGVGPILAAPQELGFAYGFCK